MQYAIIFRLPWALEISQNSLRNISWLVESPVYHSYRYTLTFTYAGLDHHLSGSPVSQEPGDRLCLRLEAHTLTHNLHNLLTPSSQPTRWTRSGYRTRAGAGWSSLCFAWYYHGNFTMRAVPEAKGNIKSNILLPTEATSCLTWTAEASALGNDGRRSTTWWSDDTQ